MRFFLVPTIASALILVALGAWLGPAAFVTALLLVVLEITLSFDNAVVNARVLSGMSERWQRRFLTWGMVFAVFGTRLVLPILIVSASAWMSPIAVGYLAAFEPDAYAHLLEGTKHAIYSFGAAFLLMVSLKYFFDQEKQLHWIGFIERRLSRWGSVEALEIGLGLVVLLGFSFLVPVVERGTVLSAGLVGIALFIFMQGVASSFAVETDDMAAAASVGAALFVYLNILDSAFSLDSVVGAFALSTAIPVIVAGLGIGAWFVRSLTIYFVRKGTLDTLLYLEHGAHWAILGLALSMFAGLLLEVPEIVTGTIGLAFVVSAYYSSLKERNHARRAA